MALLGNYSVILKNPGRNIGTVGISNSRASYNTSGLNRGRYCGWGTVTNVTDRASTPNGYVPPYSWVLAPKTGGMAVYIGYGGNGAVSNANLAGGKGGEATLTGIGTISNAAGQLIVSAVATLLGSGNITDAGVIGKLSAAATLAGSGSITAAMGALAGAVASIVGTGTVSSGDLRGTGDMSATITVSSSDIATQVWNALASNFNTAGTMGEKLNDAGSAGNPWTDTTTYGAGTKGKLLQDALTTTKFIALK